MEKTHHLQPDRAETATCAVQTRPCIDAVTHHVGQLSCHACHDTRHHHAVLHVHSPDVGGMNCLDTCEVTVVASRPSFKALGLGHKGAQDVRTAARYSGDSDVRGTDEAMHSHGTHMAWITRAVTCAITMQCCMCMRRM